VKNSRLRRRQLLAVRQSTAMNWADLDNLPVNVLNQIQWWDANGYDKPYPKP